MSSPVKRFLTNSFYMYATQIALKVTGFLVSIKVIAYLGPRQWGIYSTVLAFCSLFGFFTTGSGMDDLLISDLSKGRNNNEKTKPEMAITTVVFVRVFLGLVSFSLASTAAFLLGYDRKIIALMILLSIGMIFSFGSRNSPFTIYYVVRERRLPPELLIFLCTLVILGSKFVLTLVGGTLSAFILADLTLVILLSTSLYALGVSRGHFHIHLRYFSWDIAKSLFWRSLPLSLTAFFISIFLRIDQIMLSRMLDMDSVGMYSAAVRLVEAVNFIPVIFGALLLPVFSRHINGDKFSSILSLSFRGMAWIALIFITVVTLFGRDILHILWGNQYLASAQSLEILSWSVLFVFLGTINVPATIALGIQKYNLVFVVIQASLNVLLNLILIPRYGIAGAAISTTATYGLGFLIMWVFPAMRVIAVSVWREVLPLVFLVSVLLFIIPNPGQTGKLVILGILGLMTIVVATSSFYRVFSLSEK